MEHKIIFSGPVGAGKTTAISNISDIPVVQTEAKTSDEAAMRKSRATVAMDYGTLSLATGGKVHLYGTPGQKRFSFMWDILARGGLGLVLLIDNSRDDPLSEMEFYLNAFRSFIDNSAVVIGVNRMVEKPIPSLHDYNEKLRAMDIRAPVFEVDARERDDLKIMLSCLFTLLYPTLRH